MKEEYVLYLDESEQKKTKNFAMAGLAIKKSHIPILEVQIGEVKKLIWEDAYIQTHSPILHCSDLSKVFSERNSEKRASHFPEPYNLFAGKSTEDIQRIYIQIYGRLSNIIRTLDVTIFSCIINTKQLNDLFFLNETHAGTHMIDDKYNIALQKIIESYTHFLSYVDGCGDVLYESRNTIGENSAKSPDVKLINNFHQIHANNRGIIYTNNKIIQERNRVFSTSNKTNDVAGLQLADFVAYNILKFYSITDPSQVTDFMKQLHRKSYNGGQKLAEKDQRSFWGMRILPSYPTIYALTTSNNQLRNANTNLKKERMALKKEILKLEETISNLQIKLQQYKNLSAQSYSAAAQNQDDDKTWTEHK